MRYSDDYDAPAPGRPQRVSLVWPVLAILGLLSSAFLAMMVLGLGVAYFTERDRANALVRDSQQAAGQPGAADDEPLWNDPNAGEPPNPPYPLVADLAPPAAGAGVAPAARPAAHERFLQLGQQVWAVPQGVFPRHLRVSPDGQNVAYLNGMNLMAGPLGGAHEVVAAQTVGRPAWAGDSRSLFFADAEGRLQQYSLLTRQAVPLAFHGDCPVAVPADARQLVFRRTRARPKVDLPGTFAPPDPVEIVLGDLGARAARVVLPAAKAAWQPLAVSPDGKQLVLVSNHGLPDKGSHQTRLFVLPLTEGAPAEPKPLGPPTTGLHAVGWTADGRSLVFVDGGRTAPPDGWESDELIWRAGMHLFHMDLASGRETRLSRGGGVEGLSTTPGNDLFVLLWQGRPPTAVVRRISLTAALAFAAREPARPPREPQAWAKVADRALEAARVPPDASGEQLTPAVLARLADAFAPAYRDQFRAEPPADLAGWERLLREVQALQSPRTERSRLALVLGAVLGEHLRQRHGAAWHLGKGSLFAAAADDEAPEESPFGVVVNPFWTARQRLLWDVEEEDEGKPATPWHTLPGVLAWAGGRPLVLANDARLGAEAVRRLTRPDLARAEKLLEQGQPEAAERLLLDLLRQPAHANNERLALHAGKLLHDHGRKVALRQLLEKRVEAPPRSAHKHNLLGLALLDTDPKQAVAQFQLALRCDLSYGPGYLNLAQAYEKANQPAEAEMCLRRYLRLMSYGPHADDARQRLAALKTRQDLAAQP